MRVLVTGHLGYIGTVMVPMLIKAGHEVVGLDSDLYQGCTFTAGGDITEVPHIRKDVRDAEVHDLEAASTPSSTWRPCPTTRSAISIPTRPTASTTAVACISPGSPRRPR